MNVAFYFFFKANMFMGLSSFPSLVKVTMPAYNDSDTDRQPFKRSGKKYIQQIWHLLPSKILLPVGVHIREKERIMKI